ncbi:MAG: metal-dependent transcriptional regulator [Planctomycetota bacterium]|nr:metal-dependent transcriptional regulator [Planctomycetota bacterium]
MPSQATEDYLKHIFQLTLENPHQLVSMGDLAESMEVVPGTATSMVKKLHRDKLVHYEAYSGVKLTSKGRKTALRVLRRHRLVETLLVETFGLDWAEVHEDAERLEHAISDKLMERIDSFLGHPLTDPHGDPIPASDGEMPTTKIHRLVDGVAGDKVTITRILDQEQAFLRFIDERGLRPGTTVRIEQTDDVGDAMTVRPSRRQPVTMGRAAARKLLVEPAG